MSKYRKMPVIVEAWQFFYSGPTVPGVFYPSKSPDGKTYEGDAFVITIHGQRAYLADGDWVITEPDGEHHYPCKPDIFEAIYEEVAALDAPQPQPPAYKETSALCDTCNWAGTLREAIYAKAADDVMWRCPSCHEQLLHFVMVALQPQPPAVPPDVREATVLSRETVTQARLALEHVRCDIFLNFPHDWQAERSAPILAALKEFDAYAAWLDAHSPQEVMR